MKKLVDGLARMSGLRDRDELDFAFIRLVADCASDSVDSTWLVRVVGDGEDRRCLTRARLDAQHTQPLRDAAWTNWDALPKLVDFPGRQEAYERGKVVHVGSGPHTTIFPIGGGQGVWAILEIESKLAISAQTEAVIEGIVLTYQNLHGLLDYGEKDALTELLNRKTFDGAFFKATAEQDTFVADEAHPERRMAGPNGSYWLAMLDIDHFKRV